ncbi:MAG: ATP-binding protein, partial [Bacteroidales bacterium]|nr:ATP-binding protein [Bacteroidales bacterium]
LLIDSATVGIYEMVNRRIRVVNDTLLLWTGSERGDWKQLCLEYFIHPDHFVRLEKYVDEVRRNQNSGTSCELQLRRFDGSYIWVEHSCQVVYEQGEEVLIGTLHNVDERKKLEKDANYTSQLHRLLAETAFKFIQSDAKTFDSKIDVMLLTLGRVLNMDRSFVFRLGDDGDELTMTHEWKQSDSISVMKRFQQLRLQDFSDFKRLVFNESIIIVEDVDTFVGSDSLKKWMNDDQSKSLLMVPILGHYKILGFIGLSISRNTRIFNDAEKDLLQVLGLMMADSIERIKMEKDLKNKADGLREINRTKDKLFSVIAHDLRSPFNTFIGFTDIMCDPEMSLSSDELRTYAHVLNQQAKSTLELLQNLLDWSRLQRGVIIPRPMDVSFEYFIGQQLFLFEDKLKNKSIVVESTIEIKETISIDVRILETLFRNLFSNAVKFTPQGGIIRIRISEEHSSLLLLSIEDTGIGIPSEIMSKLFIFDEHKGRNGTEGESSSGLGLMICQEFVEILSGRIWAESVVGKGSTFFVELPFRK